MNGRTPALARFAKRRQTLGTGIGLVERDRSAGPRTAARAKLALAVMGDSALVELGHTHANANKEWWWPR